MLCFSRIGRCASLTLWPGIRVHQQRKELLSTLVTRRLDHLRTDTWEHLIQSADRSLSARLRRTGMFGRRR